MKRRFPTWTLLLLAALLSAGCASWKRPYAHDPLLRGGRGTWGDPARRTVAELPPPAEPDAPHAPGPESLTFVKGEK
jgi:hypothetical protein